MGKTLPLGNQLDLDRCPHCQIDRPNLHSVHHLETTNADGAMKRIWRVYRCARCGGVTTAWGPAMNGPVVEVFPEPKLVQAELPERAQTYLSQAFGSLHAPAGAVMLAASSIDAMLKAKGYKEGSLYARIDQAATDHLITAEMAAWAHDVRLDANDQRHADEANSLPTQDDARRALDFAEALGEFIFVLPGRVKRGREEAKPKR
jgi:Domain of unknown function (DUF4145)